MRACRSLCVLFWSRVSYESGSDIRVAGLAQLVERQPSKLNVVGSNPIPRSAAIAQLVERVLGKDEVPGSNPGGSSRFSDPPCGH